MSYTRTPKLKFALRHAGRVRQIDKKKVRVTQQQCRLKQKHNKSIETHFQEQLANNDFLELVSPDVSTNEVTSTYNTDFLDNESNVSTNEAASLHNTNFQDNESDVSTDFQDGLANDDIFDQDSDFLQDNDFSNQNANNFSQKVADEPASFEPFNGEYGPYFANFTEQMLFLWVTKYIICK
jgi:hypothetical protein